jgi:hypothetical protein
LGWRWRVTNVDGDELVGHRQGAGGEQRNDDHRREDEGVGDDRNREGAAGGTAGAGAGVGDVVEQLVGH